MGNQATKDAAIKHADSIHVDGLEKERSCLLTRLKRTFDINDALAIQNKLDDVNVQITEALAVARHLQAAAAAVDGPSQEMVDTLTRLLNDLATFAWQTEQVTKLIAFAQDTTTKFAGELQKAKALAT